jgi:hypothetical protein
MKENAYFTVEAALVLPIALSVLLFVIYMMLFQYNRCLMEQDLGALAMWGSCQEISDNAVLETRIRQRIEKIYREKYVAWKVTGLDAIWERNHFKVKGAGRITFPVPGWNFWSDEEVWETETEFDFCQMSPVTFIRLCRRVKSGGMETTNN